MSKARFEEARLRDLAVVQNRPRKPPVSTPAALRQQERVVAGTPSGMKPIMRCYGCGSYRHFRNKCPIRDKGGPAETSGKGKGKGAKS